MTGVPRRTSWVEHDARERLGILLREGRGERCGGHGAHESERGDHDRLAVLRHRDESLAHRFVESARTVDRDDGDDAGIAGHLFQRGAARDRRQADCIEHPSRADGAAVKYLVRVHEIRPVGVEVAGICGQLDGRAHLIAEQVDCIEELRQAHEISIVLEISRPAAALQIMDVGWPGDEREAHAVVPEHHSVHGIPRREHERGGGARQGEVDHTPIDTDRAAREVDLGTCRLEQRQRASRHHLHPEVLEDVERGAMNGLDLIRAEHLEGCVGIHDVAARQLENSSAAAAPRPAAGSPAAGSPAGQCSIAFIRLPADQRRASRGRRHCDTKRALAAS